MIEITDECDIIMLKRIYFLRKEGRNETMGKKPWSYSEPEAEHQFTNADKKKVQQVIYEIICENGTEDGSIILADILQDYYEEEKKEEKEKRKIREKNSAFKIIAGFLAGGLFLTFAFEKLENWGIWKDILKTGTLILDVLLAVNQFPKFSRTRKADEGPFEAMVEFLKDAGHQFLKASGLQLLGLAMIVILAADGAAALKPFEHAGVFCSGGYAALVNHADDNNNINDNAITAEEYLAEVSISGEMKLYLTGSDEVIIRQLDRAKVTYNQRDTILDLSGEKYCRVFFYEENGIKSYETQEQLNEKVQRMVEEYRREQLDNVFDRDPSQGGAPQNVQDSISLANDSEDEWSSFSDVEQRLDLRESTNLMYPKRTLTQLVANDYQGIALLLVWYGGKQPTVIYYYGHAILYNFECLKFADNTDRLIKQKLLIIAQCYEDIAYVYPNFEEAERARSLAAAFRYVADQY